jgi:hypothetical protein
MHHQKIRTVLVGATAASTLLIALSGCAGLNFRQDHRVRVDQPRDQQSVHLPVEVSWTAHDTSPAQFAVFVDQATIKPGQSLRALAKHDPACLARRNCPDAAWLSGHGVYLTDATHLTLTSLADNRTAGEAHGRDEHTAVIILIRDGKRVGESAWYRQFYLLRGAE